MRHTLLLVAILTCSATASQAGELSAGIPDCGGDAFSSAYVVEHQPPRRGPLTATPETLCADVTSRQPPVRVDIYATPFLAPPVGSGHPPAPYGDGPPRTGGQPRPRGP